MMIYIDQRKCCVYENTSSKKVSTFVSKICFFGYIYNILVYIYLSLSLCYMKRMRASIVSYTKKPQISHDSIQKHILKKILEQGFDVTTEKEYDNTPEVIYTLRKALLCDLTDKEIFTIAQTFRDVDMPTIIDTVQEPIQIQEDSWERYLSSESHREERTSDHQELQAIAMDHIAQCLY